MYKILSVNFSIVAHSESETNVKETEKNLNEAQQHELDYQKQIAVLEGQVATLGSELENLHARSVITYLKNSSFSIR